jgi:hypothetical protein
MSRRIGRERRFKYASASRVRYVLPRPRASIIRRERGRMRLPPDEGRHFLDLYTAVIGWCARRVDPTSAIHDAASFRDAPLQVQAAARDRMFDEPGSIEAYVAENPDRLSREDLALVAAWGEFVRGELVVERDLKAHTIFLDGSEPPRAFGVLSLTEEIVDILPMPLPALVVAVLLPWRSAIVCDGILACRRVQLGPGIRRQLANTYREAKARGIITVLGTAEASSATSPRTKRKTNGRPRSAAEIDLDKLRSRIRRLPREHHLMLIDHALELLPPEVLPELVRDFFRLEDLRSEGMRADVLEQVRRFCSAARAGEYYEEFKVDSRNYMNHSCGTASFIAEYHRLLRLLCRAPEHTDLPSAGRGFELLFELLREIDSFERDIVFFADEAGTWQIGVDWREVLPVWFRCVSATEPPAAFAAKVHAAIDEFASIDRAQLLQRAANLGTAAQRRELAKGG